MKLVYEIDFAALSPEERVEFVDGLRDGMAASFEAQPFEVLALAHILIFTRWWNSYKHMAPGEPKPEILGIALEVLWDYLEGKRGERELARFQQSFSDAALEILTGDDGGLNADPESDAFYRKYFAQWEAESCNVFLSNLCTVLEETAARDFSWEAVEDVVYGDIGDTMICFFEDVGRPGGGRCYAADLERREMATYATPTFARVIGLLQQDMRTALTGAPLGELRERYRSEYLFSPEESARIDEYR